MIVRPPIPSETSALATIWFESWRDSHAHLLPPDLVRERTLERFHQRIEAALERTRVAGAVGEPAGICMTKGDELDQLFVARVARGTGAAAALLADGEARIAASGATTAWLACAIGNDRAAHFYKKHGWHLAGVMTHHAETPSGVFPLETWRFEKELR
jgi:GNAT superfamily N-acetyltransferase